MTPKQVKALAHLVLSRLTRCQYEEWPGDEAVREWVDLYGVLNPQDAHNVTVERVKARRVQGWWQPSTARPEV